MSRNNILGLVFQDYFVGLRQLFNTILKYVLRILSTREHLITEHPGKGRMLTWSSGFLY